MNRRAFLRKTLAGVAAVQCVGLAGTGVPRAWGADIDGYKAIVCVFLLGGLDNHDVLIPTDTAGYQQWSSIRQSLLAVQGQTRTQASLLPLGSSNSGSSLALGLAPELSGIHSLYNQGRAGIVANVGPLVQPTTKQTFEEESVLLPPRLFSHNDQQSVWQASAPEGAQYGWGGQFADAVIAAGANEAAEFTTVTSLGNELFLTGQVAKPYQVGVEGAALIELLEDPDSPASLKQLLRRHFLASDADRSNLLARDLADAANAGLLANERYNTATTSAFSFATHFPTSSLGGQLRAVAQTIAARDALRARRQIFFVGMGGFDTHSAQATSLPMLLRQIDQAVTAFYQSMQELNLGDRVTLFTASDFGRTLAVNGDGTDHGWGGHHFVVGDAVNGGMIHGEVPPSTLGHEFDAGGGRLIPGLSVEQYASPIGRWFGLGDAEISTALPNRANFSSEPALMLG